MFFLFTFLAFFSLYLHGVSPALYGGDCGEFIASAHVLGIPHAPGYPTYIILAKAASILIPFGGIPLRINIFSAFLSALLVALCVRLFREYFYGPAGFWSAVLAAFSFGFAPLFVDQAHAAEVFSLNLLIIVSILFSIRKARDFKGIDGYEPWIYLAFFLWGIGFGNHQTILFVLPLLIGAAVLNPNKTLYYFLIILLFLLLGFSIYFVLPIRAKMTPPINFGDPETWNRFWAVVFRKEFGSTSLHPAAVPFRNLDLVLRQSRQFFDRCIFNLGGLGMIFAAGGIFWGIFKKETRRLTLAAFSSFLLFGLCFEIYSNLSPGSSIAQWRLERFFLIPLFCSFILIGILFYRLFRGGIFFRYVGLALALLFLAAEGRSFLRTESLRNNFSFYDFAISALRSAPPHSRLIIDRVLFDEPTSALLVRTQVEGKRNDVQFFYRPGTMFEPFYGKDFLDLSWPQRYERQKEVEKKLLAEGNSPWRCLAFNRANCPLANPQLNGFLYRPLAETSAQAGGDLFLIQRWRHVPPAQDFPRRLIDVHFPYFMGKEALENGDLDLAKKFFLSAQYVGQDMAWLESNIGSLYAQRDQLNEAHKMYSSACQRDPWFYEAQYGWGYVLLKEGDNAGALDAYKMAARLKPQSAECFYMLGIAGQRAGKMGEAQSAWEKFLELNPDGPQAQAVREELKKTR